MKFVRNFADVRWKIALAFAIGAVVGAGSIVQFVPQNVRTSAAGASTSTRDKGLPESQSGEADSQSVVAGPDVPAAVTADESAVKAVPKGVECAPGRNGGATDTGVTPDRISLATTVVQSGIGADFLGDVQYAMEAVRNKVNRAGGICGRLLDVRYVDDGWDANRGAQYLRNFIKGSVFAIPVGPSSEGLRVVIDSGDIRSSGLPVVGTDGMIINQYTDPWVWPVATATASSARIMARHAAADGVRKFSIVFDKNYRFGVEAAEAFNSEVKRITGADVPGYNPQHNCSQAFCGIDAGQPSYASEVQRFAPNAGELVAMFLEPATALTWMSTSGVPTVTATRRIGLGQPLFTRSFAVNCQSKCDGMWVWTGYRPPIENYANDPAVREFVSDLKKTKPDADEFNAFAQGGYAGMQLVVQALRDAGPFLTRARLKSALGSLSFDGGQTQQRPLKWDSHRYANSTMQAFAIQYKGTFAGWRAEAIVADPSPQLGTN